MEQLILVFPLEIKRKIFLIINKYILKMVVLGDVGVGKSNIIRRIMNQDFQELEATVGVEFTYIDVNDADPNDPTKVLSIQIWDTCKIFII